MSSTRRRPAAVDGIEVLAPDAAAEKITSFFSSLGEDSTVAVSVYAVDPKERLRRSFLFTLPSVAELTGPMLMEQVLAKYGPGEYLAEGRDAEGKLAFSPRFTVGPLKGGRVEIPAPTAAAPPAASSTSELAAILARQNQLLEALVAREPPSLLEQLRDLKELRELFAPPPPPPPLDLGKILETVSGVLKLRDELGDSGGEGGGVLGTLARSLAPALTKIAERAVEQPMLPAAPPASTASGGDSVIVAPPSAAEGGDVGLASNVMVRTYVAQILTLAEQGVAPAAAAQRIAGTLRGFPEPMIAAVLDWLNDENIVDELAKHDSRVKGYAQWIGETVDALLDLAEEREAPPASPAPANGAQSTAPT